MIDIFPLIGRSTELFRRDIESNADRLSEIIQNFSFLVIGGAGSIGQATVKEIFCRNPKKICVLYLSENNLAKLVRDLRSSIGYREGVSKPLP
jgi:UDP-N-acetylglucosamine 4,6-dehydratase